jgi:hypothetical protein
MNAIARWTQASCPSHPAAREPARAGSDGRGESPPIAPPPHSGRRHNARAWRAGRGRPGDSKCRSRSPPDRSARRTARHAAAPPGSTHRESGPRRSWRDDSNAVDLCLAVFGHESRVAVAASHPTRWRRLAPQQRPRAEASKRTGLRPIPLPPCKDLLAATMCPTGCRHFSPGLGGCSRSSVAQWIGVRHPKRP